MTYPYKTQSLAQWEAKHLSPRDEDFEDLEDEDEQAVLDARHEAEKELYRQTWEDQEQQRFFDGQ